MGNVLTTIAKTAALPFTFNRKKAETDEGGWTERLPDGTHATNVGLSDYMKRVAREHPDAGTDVPWNGEQDISPIQNVVRMFNNDRARPVVQPETVDVPLPTVPTSAPAKPPTVSAGTAPRMGRAAPVRPNTGNAEADDANYLDQLENDRNPEDRNGRGMSALQGAARGFIDNFARGGLYPAIRGAATRGIYGAVVPNVDERQSRDEEIGRVEARQDRRAKRAYVTSQTAENQARIKDLEDKPRREAQKSVGTRRSQLLAQVRTTGHYKRGENPTLDAQLDDAEISVSDFDKSADSFTWHESGGQAFKMNRKGETAPVTVEGKAVIDASKVPNKEGLTPVQAANLKFREKKDAADRAQRSAEFKANLSAKIRALVETERAHKVAEGQRATSIRISLTKAKAWAKANEVTLDDAIDAFDDNDVIVDDK